MSSALKLLACHNWGWIERQGTTLRVHIEKAVKQQILVTAVTEIIDATFDPDSVQLEGLLSYGSIRRLLDRIGAVRVPIYVDRLYGVRASSAPFARHVQPRYVELEIGACLDNYAHQSIVLMVKKHDVRRGRDAFLRYLEKWSHLLFSLDLSCDLRLADLMDFPLQTIVGLTLDWEEYDRRVTSIEKWQGFTSLVRLTIPGHYLPFVFQLPMLEFLTITNEDLTSVEWRNWNILHPVKLLPHLREYTVEEFDDSTDDRDGEHYYLVEFRMAHQKRLKDDSFAPIVISLPGVDPAENFRVDDVLQPDVELDPFFIDRYDSFSYSIHGRRYTLATNDWVLYIRQTTSLSLFGHTDRCVHELFYAAQRYFAICCAAFGISFARANHTKPTLWRSCVPLMSAIYDYLSDVWDCGGPHHQARERRRSLIRNLIKNL